MSALPDHTDLAPSRDPAAYGRRRLFSTGFKIWAGVCAVCLLGGLLVGRFALAPAPPAPQVPLPTAAATPPPAAAYPVYQPAAAPQPLYVPPPAMRAAPTLAIPVQGPRAPPMTLPGAGLINESGLTDRVTRLEAGASRSSGVAAEALAAATLSVAAEGAAPFDQDLAAFERLAPGDPDLAALRPLAAQGAPSRAALAAVFPDLTTQAAMAAQKPDDSTSFTDRIWAAISQIVVVRRIDPTAPGVDGLLTRAEDQAAAGDLARASETVRSLPPKARAPFAEWLAAAERRIAIDRAVASLRARALAALAASQAAPAYAPAYAPVYGGAPP